VDRCSREANGSGCHRCRIRVFSDFEMCCHHTNDLPQMDCRGSMPVGEKVPSGCHGNALPSVMKPVANLDKDFAGIQIMRSAKGEAVIQQNAAICDVYALNVHRKAFAEALAE
jgi:hypothetical protein